jgi:hypothetical protein
MLCSYPENPVPDKTHSFTHTACCIFLAKEWYMNKMNIMANTAYFHKVR